MCCNGAPERRPTVARHGRQSRPGSDCDRVRPEVTHGYQHRCRLDDERGDRRPLQAAHDLLVVGPGRRRPDRDRSRRGRLPLHARGRTDPRLQQPADVGQHRPRRSPGHRCDHGTGAQAAVRPARVRDRDPRPTRCQARRDPARRHGQGLLHARWRRGHRERDQVRSPCHRPLQGPRPVSRVSRGDDGGDDPDRRPATLGQRTRPGRSRALSGHAPLGRGGAPPGRREPPGPRGRHPLRGPAHDRGGVPRDHRRDERHPHPARRVHRRRSRDLRPARHPDGRRRGHGGLRPDRPLVRRGPLGRDPRPDDDGQGPDLELPAARRGGDAPRSRRAVRRPDVLRRPDLQQSPGQPGGRARDHLGLRGGRPHRQRRPSRAGHARPPRAPGRRAPERRGDAQPGSVRDHRPRAVARSLDADDALQRLVGRDEGDRQVLPREPPVHDDRRTTRSTRIRRCASPRSSSRRASRSSAGRSTSPTRRSRSRCPADLGSQRPAVPGRPPPARRRASSSISVVWARPSRARRMRRPGSKP